MHSFNSYIAIGDSLTEGLNDQLADGSFMGWADRLATMLAQDKPNFRYANLAVRGKNLRAIMNDQLPIALRLQPDLVTVCAGGNDILGPGADVDKVAFRFDTMIGQLRGAGVEVLICTLPDIKALSGMNWLRGKIAIYNFHLRLIAERHGATLIDLWAMDVLHDRRAWSMDRLHFTAEAHRCIAVYAAEMLGAPTGGQWWRSLDTGSLDTGGNQHKHEATNWISQLRSDIQWIWTYLLPWISRRIRRVSTGDGVAPKRPELAPLYADEGLHLVSVPRMPAARGDDGEMMDHAATQLSKPIGNPHHATFGR